ncbi:hypothetical protein Nepgr_025030 [Nepenthes gracilis]|uniref:C2H2-type domain-containing protein n=1 Tax=Nepenthes gracilis TaxID=150966 RepID=A0AAD3XZ63_NEPGR|nr:hypothetical protein Nepgr_025030 [Nepenthes gracilis]
MMVAEEEAMGPNSMIKGRRAKRQRPSSPLALTMSSASYSYDEGGATTSSAFSSAEWDHTQLYSVEEEEDLANCLILLAQGSPQKSAHQLSAHEHQRPVVGTTAAAAAAVGAYAYMCKTCNRCFPSFQALGGHRASHKKARPPQTSMAEEKRAAFPLLLDEHFNDNNSALALQIAIDRKDSCNNNNNSITKAKVHECTICGVGFSSGQALGGHMRRHRTSLGGGRDVPEQEKKTRNLLPLDLNLPAPEDDHIEQPKFVFASNEKTLAFSAAALVDCHY